MPRALFEKTGNAVWISHLDLMRVFQRAFKRAGLPLTHTQGFNPRASVSIALPLSVGIHSKCELLDFELERSVSCDEIQKLLNAALIAGVQVRTVYENGDKLKNLALMDCTLRLHYDSGMPETAAAELAQLFGRESLTVEKKSKKGTVQQDIIPMLRHVAFRQTSPTELTASARICCQNPSMNPMQLVAAIEAYTPELMPNYCICTREELYDQSGNVFR